MNYIPCKGDRIRLVAMADDPDPIRAGQIGSVIGVSQRAAVVPGDVDLVPGIASRTVMMLVSPPDTFELVGGHTDRP